MGIILGISAFYHDSAAALLVDGEICAAAQEERFSRKKHDASFPVNAVRYVLEEAGVGIAGLDAIAFYEKPYLKFERLLETYHAYAPNGVRSFSSAMPVWIKEKLFMKKTICDELQCIEGGKLAQRPPLLFPEHHLSHCASAFYPSPFKEAAILTIDGVGEWATTTIGKGSGNGLTMLRELDFPHSVGLLYAAFTYYCGFKVNDGEYKLMGLAPYGKRGSERVETFKKIILNELIDLREDGSLLLNMDYFDYATGLKMCQDEKWHALFGIPKRQAESKLSQPYMDMALAVQKVTEEVVLKLAQTARELTGCKNFVMAGGVSLNCVANGKLQRSGIFDNVWIQPAAGDAGGALGAAYAAHFIWDGQERTICQDTMDAMHGAYLGPEFDNKDVNRMCRKYNAVGQYFEDESLLYDKVADLLGKGQIAGWFQGRMEYGPRALGNRSILGDPRHPEMQKRLNLKIKYREGFRPFAPSVLAEDARQYFNTNVFSPYMLLVDTVKDERCTPLPDGYADMDMYSRLYHLRSDIPAITHVDYTARIQTVHKETNPRFWSLINAFKNRTEYGVLVNTSFNVRGEPIVCTPEDAYRCFMRTEMDLLVIGNFLFKKEEQSCGGAMNNGQDEILWQNPATCRNRVV